MRGVALILALALILVAPATVSPPTAYSQSVEAVATAAKASVAVILTQTTDGYYSGAGFMAADHLVITAYHVVEGASRIVVKFPDYRPVDASVVSADQKNDVAVVSIPALPVKPLRLGDVATVHAGETIVVMRWNRHLRGGHTPTILGAASLEQGGVHYEEERLSVPPTALRARGEPNQ